LLMAKSREEQHPVKAVGWAARDLSGVLAPFKFSRRATGEKDVTFKVLYCGICHSDLHQVKNEWGIRTIPLSLEVGGKVQKFKVGDKVGVGCLVGSCHSCENCANDLENYCPKGIQRHTTALTTMVPPRTEATPTSWYVMRALSFAFQKTSLWTLVLLLLCAGITTYSPLRYFGLDKPGMHVGVVGLGGLGHAAVKFAKAFGVKVTVISTSPNKMKEATERLGADSFLVSREPDQMQAAVGTMDGIIDTVSAPHPLLPLIGLLKSHGKLVMVGAPEKPLDLPVFPLLLVSWSWRWDDREKNSGWELHWGIKETQEMIDFAAKHNITADIELIPMDYVNTAMERLVKADVRYRFVIDIGNTLKAA
ncbi:unnamed protein product, partial [Thlaspi arvense]